MHCTADQMQVASRRLLLHIGDPAADQIKAAGFRTAGLLGPAFTMEQNFYHHGAPFRAAWTRSPGAG
jgi:aspartate racemase